MPTKVLDLEFSEEIEPIWGGEGYDSLWILVRYHQVPIGWVWVSFSNPSMPMVSAEQLRQAIAQQLGQKILLATVGSQYLTQKVEQQTKEPISVVVCTRDRAEQLADCLQGLLALDYPTYEIIVVDNAPSNDDTYKLAASLPVRYVREERPGLDWARNRGIAEARYGIVAFTDDDARADRFWLQAIAKAFAEPEVMAVTGFVAPAELETPAQFMFELDYGGMGHGFGRRIVRTETLTERNLLWASSFGVGANMAFRRDIFTHIGNFDIALDVGTPSHGAGDIEMFHRLVAQGHTLVYDPAVIVWHTHRRHKSALHRQIYDNGRSFGCYLLTCWRNRTVQGTSILKFFLYDWLFKWILHNLVRPPRKLPRYIAVIELAGMLTSPLAYRKSQAWAKKISATYVESEIEKNQNHAVIL
ncbi:glycosyltransferase [Calothrix membranacea FACHB-236]|nr:glycosyltransferase [Calothrix membranacea FACHB-236]